MSTLKKTKIEPLLELYSKKYSILAKKNSQNIILIFIHTFPVHILHGTLQSRVHPIKRQGYHGSQVLWMKCEIVDTSWTLRCGIPPNSAGVPRVSRIVDAGV